MGVIEAPRVQLTNGLFRTIEKPTSLPTAATEYPSRRSAQSFNQGGRPKAGAELTRNTVIPLILLYKLVREKRSSEAYSSTESGLRVRKSGRPVHPKGPAGGWCGTGSGELWIFLPRNRI